MSKGDIRIIHRRDLPVREENIQDSFTSKEKEWFLTSTKEHIWPERSMKIYELSGIFLSQTVLFHVSLNIFQHKFFPFQFFKILKN